jgi:hypothetical protein
MSNYRIVTTDGLDIFILRVEGEDRPQRGDVVEYAGGEYDVSHAVWAAREPRGRLFGTIAEMRLVVVPHNDVATTNVQRLFDAWCAAQNAPTENDEEGPRVEPMTNERWWLYVHDVDENGVGTVRRYPASGAMPGPGETFFLVLSGVQSTVHVEVLNPGRTDIITDEHSRWDHEHVLHVIGELPSCHVKVLEVNSRPDSGTYSK